MKFRSLLLIALSVTLFGCGLYKFTQVNEKEKTKTFQVNYFQNNAPLTEPGLELTFKQTLEKTILDQTSLDLVKSNGDAIYEGEIIEYRISPTTATANQTAAQNRLTISVKVHFYEKNYPDDEFDQRFSFYFDYAGSAQLIGSQKEAAITEIFERITQDIVNASLSNW